MEQNNFENQMDETTKILISKMEKELKAKDDEIRSKEKEIDDLKNELAILKGQILNKNRKIFGRSSEKVDPNQLSLFDEAERNSDLKAPEPEIEEIIYTRKKPSNNIGKKDNLSNLERVIIEHKLSDEEAVCDKCGSPLVYIGKKSIKEVLKYMPAKLYIEEHVVYSYACRNCEAEHGNSNIISTKAPDNFIYKGMASNELLSHVICLKYLYALPLYRQQNYFEMLGANLSRQTLSNWIMVASSRFQEIYDFMKVKLLESKYIQADETTLKVVENDGSQSRAKRYMWLYKTGGDKQPIILYEYQKTRSSTCPKNFLRDFSGYLQTDGYSGYNIIKNAKRLYCFAHVRRKYYEIIADLDEEALKKSRAIIGFNYCEKIYAIEKEIRKHFFDKEDYYEIRQKIRQKNLKPLLKEFQKYIDEEIPKALPKSALGKALNYTKEVLTGMNYVLEDGTLEIDNNSAERAIKPFVIGRKNWLFSNTVKGANSSAIIYSIIETAKANGLKVEKYLVYLMTFMNNKDIQDKNCFADAMPWSDKIPNDLKIKADH